MLVHLLLSNGRGGHRLLPLFNDSQASLHLARAVFLIVESSCYLIFNDHTLIKFGATVRLLLSDGDVFLLGALRVLKYVVIKAEVLKEGALCISN
jgi:hypothetical protein